jgi:hypothetical protein
MTKQPTSNETPPKPLQTEKDVTPEDSDHTHVFRCAKCYDEIPMPYVNTGNTMSDSMSPTPPNTSTEGLVGNIYGITVLPDTIDEWIDELYKRPVSKDEAKEVANYLISNATRQARINELEEACAAQNDYTRKGLKLRLARLKREKKDE